MDDSDSTRGFTKESKNTKLFNIFSVQNRIDGEIYGKYMLVGPFPSFFRQFFSTLIYTYRFSVTQVVRLNFGWPNFGDIDFLLRLINFKVNNN